MVRSNLISVGAEKLGVRVVERSDVSVSKPLSVPGEGSFTWDRCQVDFREESSPGFRVRILRFLETGFCRPVSS